MLQELYICAVVTVGVVLSQGGFRCPQAEGQYEAPQDCTKYFQCSGGEATLLDCPPQLIFNPQVGYCDWPNRAPNPGCSQSRENEICRTNPYGGPPEEAFHVAHPQYCNAFYTCSNSYLYAPCVFCGEGMFFSTQEGGCRDYLATGLDVNALCQGRQLVAHADKVLRLVDGSCWPFQNPPNPFQALADAIVRGPPRRPRA